MKEKKLMLLLILSLFILGLPYILRPTNIEFDYNAFYHIRAAEAIKKDGIILNDNLFAGNRPIKIIGSDVFMSYFSNPLFVKLLPILFGWI